MGGGQKADYHSLEKAAGPYPYQAPAAGPYPYQARHLLRSSNPLGQTAGVVQPVGSGRSRSGPIRVRTGVQPNEVGSGRSQMKKPEKRILEPSLTPGILGVLTPGAATVYTKGDPQYSVPGIKIGSIAVRFIFQFVQDKI